MKLFYLFIVILFLSCQDDSLDQSSSLENYLMALESSMLDRDRMAQKKWIEALRIGFERDSNLVSNQKIDLISKLERIEEQDYDLNSYEILHHLKQLYLFSSEVSDPYTIALWRYGQDLSRAYKTIKDPKLDLYEWNEFMDQVQCAIESWSFLEAEFNVLLKEKEFTNDQFIAFHFTLREKFTNFSREVHTRAEVDSDMLDAADDCQVAYRNLVAFRSNLIDMDVIDNIYQ